MKITLFSIILLFSINGFAKIANAKVTGIENARQGNFYIKDVGEKYSDDKKIEKEVRVVTTILFYLGN